MNDYIHDPLDSPSHAWQFAGIHYDEERQEMSERWTNFISGSTEYRNPKFFALAKIEKIQEAPNE